jgi:hypothetical protein
MSRDNNRELLMGFYPWDEDHQFPVPVIGRRESGIKSGHEDRSAEVLSFDVPDEVTAAEATWALYEGRDRRGTPTILFDEDLSDLVSPE